MIGCGLMLLYAAVVSMHLLDVIDLRDWPLWALAALALPGLAVLFLSWTADLLAGIAHFFLGRKK